PHGAGDQIAERRCRAQQPHGSHPPVTVDLGLDAHLSTANDVAGDRRHGPSAIARRREGALRESDRADRSYESEEERPHHGSSGEADTIFAAIEWFLAHSSSNRDGAVPGPVLASVSLWRFACLPCPISPSWRRRSRVTCCSRPMPRTTRRAACT